MPERPRHVANDPLPLKLGRAWIVSHHPYETPAGLAHNSPVEIVRLPSRENGTVVRDADSRESELSASQVTCGSWFELTPGKRVPEWDSRALDYLETLLRDEVAALDEETPHWRFAMLDNIRDQLRRHGREP